MDNYVAECGFSTPSIESSGEVYLMGNRVNLGPVHQVPVGQGRCFIVDGEEVAIFMQRDGSLRAVQNKCPHRGGPLADGIIGANMVICPLHAHRFNLETGTGSEKHECVRTFAVSIVADEIILDLSLAEAA